MMETQQTESRTWLEIDLEQICENYRQIVERLPAPCQVMAIVKADAYGVGAIPVSLALEKAGCSYFAVTFLEEALRLREAGVQSKILAMAPIEASQVPQAAAAGVTITLTEVEGAREISEAAKARGLSLEAHMKLDTGLSRLGFVTAGRESEAVSECEQVMALEGLHVTGIYTHITAASLTFPGGDHLNRQELQRFITVSDALLKKGYSLVRHCLSTGPMIDYPEFMFDYVRLGSILYGFYGGGTGHYGDFPVKNGVYLKSRVMQVKDIPAGSSISYGPLFTTVRDTRIAIVPIGFADGLRRALSNVGKMMIHGQWAPIIGKICCDHTILDVTDLPDVKRGDYVTIWGRDGGLEQTPGDYARLVGATAAETTAVLNQRIPRIALPSKA